MDGAISKWKNLTSGTPSWVSGDVRTIRFSNTVARELAKLITHNIDIKTEQIYGSAEKALFIQSALGEHFLENSQEIMENVICYGGVMAKWNGKGIDYMKPDMFVVTEFDSNKNITGCIFFSYYAEGKKYYTRAEWHRFETIARKNEQTNEYETLNVYKISNKAFVSDDIDETGEEIPLSKTKWKDIQKETTIENLEHPLFAYIRNPYSNTVDSESPLGMSSFHECLEELRWIDIAMSNMGAETEVSAPIMFVDESAIRYANNTGIKLPKFIKGLSMGVNQSNTIEQWQPELKVTSRIEGINFYLSIIGYKCGFDPGYFVFNGQSIVVATATQVEATERRTVNTVLSYRNLLDRPNINGEGRIGFVHDIAYVIDAMSTMNGEYNPSEYGNYKLYCDFADLTENAEEEKAFDYQLAMQGFISKARFLVLHKGMTEEEAVAMVREAEEEKNNSVSNISLFGEE